MQNNKFLKLINNAQSVESKGKPNGYAPLDENGKIPVDFIPESEGIGSLDPSVTLENFKNWGEIPTDEEACLYANTINFPSLPNDIGGRNTYPYWIIISKIISGVSEEHWLLASLEKNINISFSSTYNRYDINNASRCYKLSSDKTKWSSISAITQINGSAYSITGSESNYYGNPYLLTPNKGGDGHIVIRQARGTATALDTYTGKEGELTVDTTNKTIRVQDGTTLGGIPLAKKEEIDTVDDKLQNHLDNHPSFKEFDYVDLGKVIIDDGTVISYYPNNYPEIPLDSGIAKDGQYPYWLIGEYGDGTVKLLGSESKITSGTYEDTFYCDSSSYVAYTLKDNQWTDKSISNRAIQPNGMKITKFVKETNFDFWCYPSMLHRPHILIHKKNATKKDLEDLHITFMLANITDHTKYLGSMGEVIVDINQKRLVLQDGVTKGGIPLAKKSEVDNLSSRVDEVFQSVSNGKNLLARAITDKGINTLATDNFETMSNNIKNIKSVDIFKIYLGEEEPESPEEGCLWFPEIDANEKVNLAFTNTESHLQKDDGTILGTISLKEVDRFPLLNISNFMMVRMFNFKYFKDGFGIITPAYICNGGEWFCVYNFPPFDGTGIKYKIKIDNRYDNLTSYVGCKLSMSNIVQAPIKNNYIINCKIKTECDIEAPVINLK